MKPDFIHHLRSEWPLALVVALLLIYLPVVLVTGVFFTNQGNILRSVDPARYWRWVTLFLVLLASSAGVLVGSYLLK